MELPRPPRELVESAAPRFVPAPEFAAWAMDAFVLDGPAFNPDHAHLAGADLAVLLTNVSNVSRGKATLGTAQMGKPTGKPWSRGRAEQQLLEWFDRIPDFLITLDARFLAGCEPLQACALMEHEMYHCGVKVNALGETMYDEEDRPIFDLRPHDIEEFAGVVRRYGAWSDDLREFQEALWLGPTIGPAKIDGICGTCSRGIA